MSRAELMAALGLDYGLGPGESRDAENTFAVLVVWGCLNCESCCGGGMCQSNAMRGGNFLKLFSRQFEVEGIRTQACDIRPPHFAVFPDLDFLKDAGGLPFGEYLHFGAIGQVDFASYTVGVLKADSVV